jgi:RNA polymerase sigma-70 factor (ECF subfamily)
MAQRTHEQGQTDDGVLPVFLTKRSLDEESAADRRRLRHAIAGARNRDSEAMRHIYERYADNVYSYVRTILHDDHEAEDVTQHVFTKLLTKIQSYEERSVPFTAWLLRIARNCAIDHMRSKRAICCEEVPAEEERPGYDEVAADQRDAIEDALDSIPASQRRVVVLRHVVGLSPNEIATRMGKSEGAIHTLHHRARRAMQAELLRRHMAPVSMTAGRSAA